MFPKSTIKEFICREEKKTLVGFGIPDYWIIFDCSDNDLDHTEMLFCDLKQAIQIKLSVNVFSSEEWVVILLCRHILLFVCFFANNVYLIHFKN